MVNTFRRTLLLLIILNSFSLAKRKNDPLFPLGSACSACGAIMQELYVALEAELPPLGSAQKIVTLELSERRVFELLEGICGKMSSYAYLNNTQLGVNEFVKVSPLGTSRGGKDPTKMRRLKKYCENVIGEYEDLIISAIGGQVAGSEAKQLSPLVTLASDLCVVKEEACTEMELGKLQKTIKESRETVGEGRNGKGAPSQATVQPGDDAFFAVPGN